MYRALHRSLSVVTFRNRAFHTRLPLRHGSLGWFSLRKCRGRVDSERVHGGGMNTNGVDELSAMSRSAAPVPSPENIISHRLPRHPLAPSLMTALRPACTPGSKRNLLPVLLQPTLLITRHKLRLRSPLRFSRDPPPGSAQSLLENGVELLAAPEDRTSGTGGQIVVVLAV